MKNKEKERMDKQNRVELPKTIRKGRTSHASLKNTQDTIPHVAHHL